MSPSELRLYCETKEEQAQEEREWKDWRFALLTAAVLNGYVKKKVNPFDLYKMPKLKEAMEKQKENDIDDRIIGMYKAGLVDENHSTYGEKIKRWLERSEA